MLRTTDNSDTLLITNPEDFANHFANLKKIANVRLDEIKLEDQPNILIFPSSWDKQECKIRDKNIFSISEEGKLKTGNIMGFIGIEDTTLTITSRFAKDDERDFFLHYLLSKVLSINVVDLPTVSDQESYYDLLPFLFPTFLKSAMSKGVYKQYRHKKYNDPNVKGTIDVARHLRTNIPFAGNIAYNTREYSYNNNMTQLIRHTIEYLKDTPMGREILFNDPETSSNVRIIREHTPDYSIGSRKKIVAANLRQTGHPYFTEYRPLQKLCLQILRYDKIAPGADKDKIHGILFDGAWLWEKYIANVFKQHLPHIKHKTSKDWLFKKNERGIIPDYITYTCTSNTFSASFIGDAKYKFFDERSDVNANQDYFQIISYMYRYSCKKGYIFFPYTKEDDVFTKGNERVINNGRDDSSVIDLGLRIPQSSSDFKDFSRQMGESEEKFIRQIKAAD